MQARRRGRLAVAVGAAVLLALGAVGIAPGAGAQDPGDPVELRGFATGMPAHIDALNPSPDLRMVDTEVAWSGASVDADEDGLKGAKLNEVSKTFQPDRAGKLSYARGSGLELGLGTNPPVDDNQIQLTGFAQADAPPSSDAMESTDIDIDPVARASLLRGTAVANANESGLVPDVCVLGDDISRGTGYATDVELLDAGADNNSPEFDAPVLALDDQDPDRAVTQSTSRMKLVPNGGKNTFGLMAETRQTIAPISVLQDDDNDPLTPPAVITIEVLGEWVLRVVASGNTGGASVHYGPADDTPITQAVRITGLGDPIIITLQDFFGDEGLDLPLIPGVLELTIGEDPRAIAAPGANPDASSKPALAANGRSASAAADVVRVRVLDGQLVDLRVGHMEVSAEVPAGGVTCPIPVTKTADPDNIKIDEQPDTSEIGITVHNVYDCDFTDTVLTDRIRQREGDPDFKLITADPAAESPNMPTGALKQADVVWKLGTIPKGTTKSVSLDLQSANNGGILRDIAEAVSKLANCSGEDASGLAIAGLSLSGLSIPVDVSIETPVTGAQAARTVATGGGLALAASALGLAFRRRSGTSA